MPRDAVAGIPAEYAAAMLENTRASSRHSRRRPRSRRRGARSIRLMTDTPWLGGACSLVDAFRSGERTPLDELEATLDAIERPTSMRSRT